MTSERETWSARGGTIPALDGLRGLAVLGPVVHHFWPEVPRHALTLPIRDLGTFGVDLFFVLSGFLITWILLRHRDADGSRARIAGAFYVRRVLRIFPPYYALLAALLLLGLPLLTEGGALPWHLTYTSNWWIASLGEWPDLLSHCWSLAVEEQFYLLWPAVVLLLPRRWLLGALVGLALAAPLWMALCLAPGGLGHFWGRMMVLGCLDDLAGGGVIAVLWLTRPRLLPGVARALTLVGALAAGAHAIAWVGWHPVDEISALSPVVHTSTALLFMGLVGSLVTRDAPRPVERALTAAPLRYLGRISYGVYLLHLPLPWILGRLGFQVVPVGALGEVAVFLVVLASTVGLAALSWHLFEAPLNRLKRLVPYRAMST